MKIFFLFVFCLGFSAVANSHEENYFYEDSSRKSQQSYFLVNNKKISATPECKKNLCMAYKIATEKVETPPKIKWLPGGANPTSSLCDSKGGQAKVGYRENGNEISLCYFKDGSFIFGWDLIRP